MKQKDSKAIHGLFKEFHSSDNLGLLKLKLVNYVTAVRREERRAAFKESAESIVNEAGKRYLLDQIPAGLWARVRAKAKQEGVSLRALILRLLTEWLED